MTIHTTRNCFHSLTKIFFFCKNKEYTSKVCRKNAKLSLPIKHSFNVVSETTLVESSEDDLFSIYQLLTSNVTPPIMVFITIAGHKLPIEIDTGASISLLNWETFQKINCESNISLLQTKSKLKTYSGEIVSPKGKSDIEFTYEGNKIRTTFLITGKRSPNVLGRDILGKLRLNCENIFHSFAASEVVSTSDNVALNKIISDYKVVFSDELETLKDFQANIPIDPQVTPKYFCARPVLYSLKEKIEHELDRLVKLGIYCPVASSKWAVPIVPVFKVDGSSCICGDYKQTVNKAADCDKYPILKVKDIFATLNWGEKFTKPHLSQAYQQLLLSLHSRELLTINLHKSLFQPTRLQFGVHSVSGIFQRELENRLASIPCVKVPSDNILYLVKMILNILTI